MSDGCYEIEDLDDLIAASARGEPPAHLGTCPKCRALLASYRVFVAPPDVPAGGNLRVAAERLRLEVLAGFPPGTAQEAPSGTAPARRPWLRLVLPGAALGRPWLRPVWAAGLVAMVAVVFWQLGQDSNRDLPSHVLRGEQGGRSEAVQVLAPTPQAGGGVTLAWQAAPAADAYDVVFYRADLSETGRRRIDGASLLTLSAAELNTLTGGGAAYWQIIALKSGAEIGRSSPRALEPAGSGR